MPMTPEEAQYCADMRQRILANTQKGLPPHTGITPEEVQKALDYCRADYTASQTKSKASGVGNPSGGGGGIDLAALFTEVKSK